MHVHTFSLSHKLTHSHLLAHPLTHTHTLTHWKVESGKSDANPPDYTLVQNA